MALALTSRYVAVETSIGMAVSGILATAPILLWQTPSTVQSLHALAVSLAPQIMMGAFMSAMVPALLTRWRQGRGRIEVRLITAPPTLQRTAVTAVLLASTFTVIMLALLHFVLPSIVGDSIGRLTRLAVSGTQGVMAAALLTPLTLVSLFGAAANEITLPAAIPAQGPPVAERPQRHA